MPPPEGSKARRTHDTLLEAMEQRLQLGGWEAATSTAVAEAAGVSVGTFYGYFSDRDDALAALFERRLDGLVGALGRTLSADALLDDGLASVLASTFGLVLDEYAEHAATYRAALVQLPSSPRIRDVYWRAHREIETMLITFLTRAQTAGMVRPADPVVLARTVLVVVQGANNPLLLSEPRSRRTRAIAEEVVGMLHHLFAPRGTAT